MVRDGYYYGLPLIAVGALLGWLTRPAWGIIPCLLAIFFLWFFRDPERTIPQGAGLIVSPADGLVTEAEWVETTNGSRLRVSIFLNVFDVHVNRVPISGTVTVVNYRPGAFLNAMNPESVVANEQAMIVIAGDGYEVAFKQIAGLLARRIVFNHVQGERVQRGQRIGLIKFGSRVDVILPIEAAIRVKVGEHVQGGATVLAAINTGALL